MTSRSTTKPDENNKYIIGNLALNKQLLLLLLFFLTNILHPVNGGYNLCMVSIMIIETKLIGQKPPFFRMFGSAPKRVRFDRVELGMGREGD